MACVGLRYYLALPDTLTVTPDDMGLRPTLRVRLLRAPAMVLALVACADTSPPDAAGSGQASATADPVAQPAGALDVGDATMIRDYRLTMAGIRQYVQATENFQAAIARDPSLQRRLDAMEEAPDADRIGDFVQVVDQIPEWRRAIERAGISTHDYAMVMATLTASALYVGMRRMGMDPARDEWISDRNVAVVEENWEEIEQLMHRMRDSAYDDTDW